MGNPTRFPSGVSTQSKTAPLGDYPLPDPFHTGSSSGKDVFTYSNDFADLGNAASRTVTGASSTFALVDGLGGVGTLTPGGATTASSIYRTAAPFQFISGNKFWFVHRVKYSGVTGVTGYVGVIKTGAATTDSLLFKMASGGALTFVSTVNSTATTLVSSTVLGSVTAGGWLDVAFYYDGTDLFVYRDDVMLARVNAPSIGASATTLTNAALTPIIQITPAASETLSIDYALIAQEVTR